MSLFKGNVPPSRVPTLTDVVEVNGLKSDLAIVAAPPTAAPGIAPKTPPVPLLPTVAAAPHPVDADRLTQLVMADIQRQIDAMLEVRLKEALAPIISRMTDALARDARSEMAKVMKEVVARAVADEMRRALSKP